MKKKKGFNLRNVCGEFVIVAEGTENIDFSKIVGMNESAAYLWGSLGEEPFTQEDVTRLLLREYEVSEEIASRDAADLMRQWSEAGIVEQD